MKFKVGNIVGNATLHCHLMRVGNLSLSLANELNLSESLKKQIYIAGLMHDIGKIRIDDEILDKPGKLTEDEFEIVKHHVFYSASKAKEIGVNSLILKMVYHHHESYDGSGYPEGLKEKEIPIGARILKVADYFDSLVSDRPYRRALSEAEAFEIMDQNKKEFDPELYETFKKEYKNKWRYER